MKNLSKNVEIKLLIWHKICFYWKNRWLSPPKPYIFHKASLFDHLLSIIPKGACQRFSSHIKRIAPHLPHSWPRSHYLTYVCDWVFISSISKSSWPISMKLGRMMCNELSSIMKGKTTKSKCRCYPHESDFLRYTPIKRGVFIRIVNHKNGDPLFEGQCERRSFEKRSNAHVSSPLSARFQLGEQGSRSRTKTVKYWLTLPWRNTKICIK